MRIKLNKSHFIEKKLPSLRQILHYIFQLKYKIIYKFYFKVLKYELTKYNKSAWPLIKFDEQDDLSFRITQENILEITCMKTLTLIEKVQMKYQVDQFYISPKNNNIIIHTILVEHQVGFERQDARMSIFSYNNKQFKPLYSDIIPKAQEVTLYWAPDGLACLIMSQTYHDETNSSYYGQSILYHFDAQNQKLKQIPTKEGPIHDVAWSPNSENFIVISGFMPACSVIFDKKCQPFFEFGKHHKNMIKFSPLSRFVVLGGFGNLSGEIEIWDVFQLKLVGQCKANSAVGAFWSPDGRTFATAVLNPRLRVDNHYKIFEYNGQQLHYLDLSHTELYECLWRPQLDRFKDRSPSPNKKPLDLSSSEVSDKPKKILNLRRSEGLSNMISEQKGLSGGRSIGADYLNEKKDIQKDKNLPPGSVILELNQKKKRVRGKKQNKDDDDLE